MERRSVEAIVRALNEAGARYLIAGGLAVVAHGYVRFTADLDLILDMSEENVRRALDALKSLDYRPRAPVALTDFASADKRAEWAREKQMTVFSLHSPDHPATEVDLFVEPPLDFEQAYATSAPLEVAEGVQATFLSLDDLVSVKRDAGRAQDLKDVDRLLSIRKAMQP